MNTELKPQTLMVAIQCVAARSNELSRGIDSCDISEAENIEQLLLSMDIAADDLKSAYQEALKLYGNLPSYEELVSNIS